MISNERKWPSHSQTYRPPQPEHSAPRQPRPYIREDTLKSKELQIERKQFLLMLKTNPRGCFLRIAEESNGKQNSIIIPASGLREFQKLLTEMATAADQIPPSAPPAEPSVPAGQ